MTALKENNFPDKGSVQFNFVYKVSVTITIASRGFTETQSLTLRQATWARRVYLLTKRNLEQDQADRWVKEEEKGL